jgi:hypothetical protein
MRYENHEEGIPAHFSNLFLCYIRMEGRYPRMLQSHPQPGSSVDYANTIWKTSAMLEYEHSAEKNNKMATVCGMAETLMNLFGKLFTK